MSRADVPDRPTYGVPGGRLAMTLHHLGVACVSIDTEGALLEAVGFVREGPDFEDPFQGVRGRFVVGAGVRLELLEELEGSSVLRSWLAQRTKVYHQAYLTYDLDGSLSGLVAGGAHAAKSPLPAVAFGGRRVAFAMLPNMMLVELVEAPRAGE